jgi:hypothetical protein
MHAGWQREDRQSDTQGVREKGRQEDTVCIQVDKKETDQSDTEDDREKGRQEDTLYLQVDRERIDRQSDAIRMTEREGDRKILYACRLTERG